MNDLIADIEQIVKLVKKQPEKIIIYISAQWKNILYQHAKELFKDEAFNIGKLMGSVKNHGDLSRLMKEVSNEAKLMMKDPTIFRITMIDPEEQKAYRDPRF